MPNKHKTYIFLDFILQKLHPTLFACQSNWAKVAHSVGTTKLDLSSNAFSLNNFKKTAQTSVCIILVSLSL